MVYFRGEKPPGHVGMYFPFEGTSFFLEWDKRQGIKVSYCQHVASHFGHSRECRVRARFCCCCCCLVAKSCLTLQPHGLQPIRLLCPWDFPGKNTGVGCHFLLQGIFLTQGSNLHLLHWQADSLLWATREARTRFRGSFAKLGVDLSIMESCTGPESTLASIT